MPPLAKFCYLSARLVGCLSKCFNGSNAISQFVSFFACSLWPERSKNIKAVALYLTGVSLREESFLFVSTILMGPQTAQKRHRLYSLLITKYHAHREDRVKR